jgi:hypothetical protein
MLKSVFATQPSPTSKRARQTNIPRASTHIHIESPHWHLPRLTAYIPVAKILPANVESDRTGSARSQRHLLETAELLRRRSWRARRQTDVQLCDFGASHGAVVCDLRSHGGDSIEETNNASWAWSGAACGLVGVGGGQAGVAERCVGFVDVSRCSLVDQLE